MDGEQEIHGGKYYNVNAKLYDAAELPLEEVYCKWPTSTDPDVHAKALINLFNSGATIVNVHSGQPDQRHMIEFYGERVLPRVRAQLKEV